jgi:hypothetical protein
MPYVLPQARRCSYAGRAALRNNLIVLALPQDEDYVTLKQRVCAHAAKGLPGSPTGLVPWAAQSFHTINNLPFCMDDHS